MTTRESTAPPVVTSGVKQLTARAAPHLRRWARTRLLPIALLICVIAWAAVQIRTLNQVEEPESIPESIVAHSDPLPEPALAGIDVEPLLELKVASSEEGGEEFLEELGGAAIEPGRLTVVNLWATFCKPCKDELPGLREVIRGAQTRPPHGGKVRFVPLLVDSGVTLAEARTTYDGLGGPAPNTFVADVDLGGGVRGKLTELGLIEGELALPVTLVVDCNRRLRWHHLGALRSEHFTELAATLAKLQEEFDGDTCPKPPQLRRLKKKTKPRERLPEFLKVLSTEERAASTRPKPRSVCTRDQVCARDKGENELNCPGDCTPSL